MLVRVSHQRPLSGTCFSRVLFSIDAFDIWFYGRYLTTSVKGCQAQFSEVQNLNPADRGQKSGVERKFCNYFIGRFHFYIDIAFPAML